MKKLIVAPFALFALVLMPASAQAWPAPVGGCAGHFVLQTLDPSAPSYMPESPAHKDNNADGWLCYNGHGWNDNKH
jgi:hypothetical protein